MQRQVQDLQAQLEQRTHEAEVANNKAEKAEHREREMQKAAKKFWKEEWSGMRDYMLACSEEKYVKEIEERILSEYEDLFGGVERAGVGTML
jgi:hypothetical protein